MAEIKTVVAGEHGPVPMAENSHRFIGDEPVVVDLQGKHGAYYARRLMFGDLVEVDPQKVRAEHARRDAAAKKEGV